MHTKNLNGTCTMLLWQVTHGHPKTSMNMVNSLYRSLRRRCQHTQASQPDDETHNFYHYTSGRWVWDEERQLEARYRRFNVHELQKIAAKSVSAASCVHMEKLAEGASNKVFRLTMNDHQTVIARIPNPNAGPAGPAKLTTASEVATLDFVGNSLLV